ncbi:MAG: hypothetical protein JWN98_532 [Abditibacteriota bacterium]|nr:hypothetical protein [Abditibacteriota bacterium]
MTRSSPAFESLAPATVHEQLQLSLLQVERSTFPSLHVEVQRAQWAFSHVVRGQVVTSCAGRHFDAPAGSVMIHPPHLPYQESAQGQGQHHWIVFEAFAAPNIELFRLHPIAPVVKLTNQQLFTQKFEALLDVWHRDASPFRGFHAMCLGGELLWMLLESWHQAGSPPRPKAMMTSHDRFIELIDFMAGNLHRKLSRDELARRAHLHPNYLDRAFRDTYGVAPMSMLRDMRLRRARHLLESTELSLQEVGKACGFEDVPYFTRAFRNRYDAAPGQLRESVKTARESYLPPSPPGTAVS